MVERGAELLELGRKDSRVAQAVVLIRVEVVVVERIVQVVATLVRLARMEEMEVVVAHGSTASLLHPAWVVVVVVVVLV